MAVDIAAASRYVQAAAGGAETSAPPSKELGTAGEAYGTRLVGSGFGVLNWQYFIDTALEHVPELKWPKSIRTFHTMRNDSQVQGLFLGTTLPIRRYNWFIEPNGARDEVVKQIADDYNLPVRGREDEPRGRQKNRFAFKDHLRHVLLAVLYGHMYFEQVGDIGDDGLWHLKKLGPRMPQSIMQIKTDIQDGGLQSIVQWGGAINPSTGKREREIPVEKLVAYIWEQEGANWAGRSMLRGIYKNWLLKDTVLRVGAINIERAGGVPVITGPKGATPDDLQQLALMARQFRIGEDAGGAIPNGAELTLAKAAGGDEAVNFIKLMNEEMGRGWLMMFMNLGQSTHGSFALGSSLIDFVLNTQETVAQWVCDVFNEHMIEDHVDWNWGEKEQAPLLGYTRNDDRQLALKDLVAMIDAGLIQMDDELENWVREEYQMPRRQANAVARPVPVSTSPAIQASRYKRTAGLDSPASSSADPLAEIREEIDAIGDERIAGIFARAEELIADA